jgi:hypothetical protein
MSDQPAVPRVTDLLAEVERLLAVEPKPGEYVHAVETRLIRAKWLLLKAELQMAKERNR